jgi:predicted Fe-Mo cluster-binding NifX family protein
VSSRHKGHRRILIVLYEDDVAPRFDLAMGVFIAETTGQGEIIDRKTLVLPQASAEDLCRLILTEQISTLICGGIEQEYYDYLTWKHIRVVDSVIGPFEWALERLLNGSLKFGDICPP